MPQNARPSADASIGAWTDQSGGTAALFSKIDEPFPDEADHIRTEILFPGDTSTPYVTKLGAVADPSIHTAHRVRYFIKKVDPGIIDLTVQLRQGYVSEGQPGTLLAQKTEIGISNLSFEADINLSESEAGLITDYGDLYLRFFAARMPIE